MDRSDDPLTPGTAKARLHSGSEADARPSDPPRQPVIEGGSAQRVYKDPCVGFVVVVGADLKRLRAPALAAVTCTLDKRGMPARFRGGGGQACNTAIL